MPDPNSFITKILPSVQAAQEKSGIPASLAIAQAALESNWGESVLTKRANNLFGMKGTGPAGSVTMQTTEVIRGSTVTVNAAFRAYHNWAESIGDYINLLQNARYSGVRGKDGITAATAVAAAGYATDPSYASKLIRIIDSFKLLNYDKKPTPAGYTLAVADAEKILRFLSAGSSLSVTPAGRAEFDRLAAEVRASVTPKPPA